MAVGHRVCGGHRAAPRRGGRQWLGGPPRHSAGVGLPHSCWHWQVTLTRSTAILAHSFPSPLSHGSAMAWTGRKSLIQTKQKPKTMFDKDHPCLSTFAKRTGDKKCTVSFHSVTEVRYAAFYLVFLFTRFCCRYLLPKRSAEDIFRLTRALIGSGELHVLMGGGGGKGPPSVPIFKSSFRKSNFFKSNSRGVKIQTAL